MKKLLTELEHLTCIGNSGLDIAKTRRKMPLKSFSVAEWLNYTIRKKCAYNEQK